MRLFLLPVLLFLPPLLAPQARAAAWTEAVAAGRNPNQVQVQSRLLTVDVTVFDSSHLPVPAAQVQIKRGEEIIWTATTGATGHASFPGLKPGPYSIIATREGFDPAENNDFIVAEAGPLTLELTLVPKATKVSVEVHDTVSPMEEGSVPSTAVTSAQAKELPNRPATVTDALPLIPGVARAPGGGLQLSGRGENRSALIVNSADVTDPATGAFGLTVPIDSVENLSFYQTSYLAEYGRFTAGLVSVDTRRGGDKWKWEVNDPFPEFNIRSWHLRGMRTATPRLNFEGPLIARKLYLSEGFEYEVRKTAIYTLPFPYNQKKTEGLNSFSQLDWITSDRNLMTGTLHIAPQRLGYVNMDYFNPQPTTPDASTHNYTGTLSDKLTVFGGMWENTFSATKFDARVWPKGDQELILQPQGNSGNYFSQQTRDAERYGLASTFAGAPWHRWGAHNFKVGAYLAGSFDDGRMDDHSISTMDFAGNLLERIELGPGRPFRNSDTEFDLFAQDHWNVAPRLSVDIGLRTESQELSGALRFAPRAGIAWSPFAGLGTVIRAGVGAFYDRVPLGVYSFDHYPSPTVTFYNGAGQITRGPILLQTGLGEVITGQELVIRTMGAGNFSPGSTNGSVQIEQPVTPYLKLRAGYLQSVSSGLIILDSTLRDPEATTGRLLLSGSGTGRYRQLEFTARLRVREQGQLMFSYVRSRTTGDLNDFASYMGSFPLPILRPNQVATSPTDLPDRFLAWGRIKFPRGFGISPVIEYRSGFPYLVTNAAQDYVGVPNSARYPRFLSVDARVWKDFQVNPKYAVRISVSGFNLTNHFNPEVVHGNVDDPAYGRFFGERHRRFTADFDVIF